MGLDDRDALEVPQPGEKVERRYMDAADLVVSRVLRFFPRYAAWEVNTEPVENGIPDGDIVYVKADRAYGRWHEADLP